MPVSSSNAKGIKVLRVGVRCAGAGCRRVMDMFRWCLSSGNGGCSAVQCIAVQCMVCVCMGHVCEDGDGDRRGGWWWWWKCSAVVQ